MVKYDKQKNYEIKVEKISLDALKEKENVKDLENSCTLFWAEDYNDIQLLFCSNTIEIQALEFMDYFMNDYARVQGNAMFAKSTLTATFLQVMMSDFETKDVTELFEKVAEQYFVECDCICSKDFAEQMQDKISEVPRYVKRKIPWAYVKITDVMDAGTKFYLKSMENESRLLLEASDEIYIMIGCRGEVYHIAKEKFERTYEASEEQLDIFEQMISYLPEIQNYETGEYIPLDESAYLCYPKTTNGIYAVPLKARTKVFNKYNNGEYFLGRKDDYMAIRYDDLSDIYVIQKDIFHETYEELEKN